MKSVIFDFITGAAIIMGLVIVAKVMKANQFFIESSAQTETDVEQLYVGTYDEDADGLKDNTYTVADVYGTLTTLTRSNGALMEKYEFIVRTPGVDPVAAYGDKGTLQERQTGVQNVRTLLETMLGNPDAYKFKKFKSQKVNPWHCSVPECPDGGATEISGSV